ncbi:MAG: hypothetical protein ACE5F6_17050, partial [Anaerolineae bacterium]
EGIIYVALRGDTSTQLSASLNATPPAPGQVVALRDMGTGAEILWSVEAAGEIWTAAPVIGPNDTLYFADAVCMDYQACDENTDVPSLYAVVPAQCVGDANSNGVRDVVDIMTTANQSTCQVYLPLVAAHWREPWPTSTLTLTPMPTTH